jgi:ABC-type dipeptide/oligopeptide/nickel transport system ATPase component
MENGIFVETGLTSQIFEKPQMEYTQKLISSIPGHKKLQF